MSSRGVLFIVSGPSGAGKTTLCKEASRLTGIPISVSATTRPRRPGEKDGVDYIFMTEDEFMRRVEEGWFYEYARVHGNLYGTPAGPVEEALQRGECMLLDIDVQGAAQVRKRCTDSVTIFIMPPSEETLAERLRKRGTEDEAALAARLERAREEMAHAEEYDHTLVNDDLDRALSRLVDIIMKEKEKKEV